jgi:hypothetical protein
MPRIEIDLNLSVGLLTGKTYMGVVRYTYPTPGTIPGIFIPSRYAEFIPPEFYSIPGIFIPSRYAEIIPPEFLLHPGDFYPIPIRVIK